MFGVLLLIGVIAGIPIVSVIVYIRTGSIRSTIASGLVLAAGSYVVYGLDGSTWFGRFMFSPRVEQALERRIGQSYVLSAVFRDFPSEKDEYISTMSRSFVNKKTALFTRDLFSYELRLARNYFDHYIEKANPHQMIEFSRSITKVSKKLSRSAPVACYALIAGEGELPPEIDFHLSTDDERELQSALASIFVPSRGNRKVWHPDPDRVRNLKSIIRQVRKSFAAGTFILPRRGLTDRQKSFACLTLIALITAILKQPTADAGPMLQALFLAEDARLKI